MSEVINKVNRLIAECDRFLDLYSTCLGFHKSYQERWQDKKDQLVQIRDRLIDLEKELPCT